MKTTVKFIFIVVSLVAFNSCAPTRFVKPLQKNQNAVSFSFGGPLIKFAGAPIPIPFTTLAYGNGITVRVTAFGSLHTTSLLFGNLQTDIGANILIFEKINKGGVSATPAFQMAYNLTHMKGFRVWPTVDVNGWLHIKESRSFIYAGVNTWFELSSKRAHGEKQARHLLPNFHAGYMIVKEKWQHQFQAGYLGAGIPNLPGVVEYIGISGKGTLGFHYSITRIF